MMPYDDMNREGFMSSDIFSEFAKATRKSLDNPKSDPICYMCDAKIEPVAKFIEYIAIFMRYVNICEACHKKHEIGEFVEIIKIYEEYLAGTITISDYMKVYYKFYPRTGADKDAK